jgi:hypothetical protein
MNTIGELLARDLDCQIEEIIQVDQTDEQSVYEKLRNILRQIVFAISTPSCSVRLPKPQQSRRRVLACGFRAFSARGKVRLPRILVTP